MSSPFVSFKTAFAAVSEPSYFSGTVPLDANTATLFYRSGEKSYFVDFSSPTDLQLVSLSEACQPASFGMNQKDVIDESYRKAGKMDASNFASQFSPVTSGIIDSIRECLLHGKNIEKDVKVELYKLNVYGPGSFFKAHVDTPRSDTMFGSLVVILPTVHTGGSLVFHHEGKDEIFDTAKAVSQDTPCAAFVAFFSDIEHEVSVVTSGYRVTLTYNLYFVDHPSLPPPSSVGNEAMANIKSTFATLLGDPKFLPEGGLLGFGLSHKYPVNPGSTKLSALVARLKGTDAAIQRICKTLGLNPSLKTLYKPGPENGNVCCLLTGFAYLKREIREDDNVLHHIKNSDPSALYAYDFKDASPNFGSNDRRRTKGIIPIAWVKPLTNANSVQTAYIAHGNQASLSHTYGSVCIVVVVDRAEKRIGW